MGANACEIANSRSRDDAAVTESVASGSIILQLGRLGGEGSRHYGNKLEGTSCVSATIFMYVASSRRCSLASRDGRGEEETSYESLVRGFWLIDDAKL